MGAALALLLLAPTVAGQGDPGPQATPSDRLTDPLTDLLDDLAAAQAALADGEASSASEHVERAGERLASLAAEHPRLDAQAARAALDAAANESAPQPFSTHVVGLEAQLLALAAARAEALATQGQAEEARGWVAWLRAHVVAPGRLLPPPATAVNGSIDGHALEAEVDGLLAARVLEEVAAAELLTLHGGAGAEHHARRAGLLWTAVGDRLAPDLFPATAASLAANLSSLPGGLDDVRIGGATLAHVTGPLTALTFHRSIDRLQAITASLSATLALANRTHGADPGHATELAQAAEESYRNHRDTYLVHGDGGLEASDASFERLRVAIGQGDLQAARVAAGDGLADLRALSRLGHGLRFIVREDGPAAGGGVQVSVGLAETSLEGIASYNVTLGFDPAEVEVVEVAPGWSRANATVARGDGSITLESHGAPAAFGGTLLARLVVEPSTPGATPTLEVLEHAFTTPAGHHALAASVTGLGVDQDEPVGSASQRHDHDHDHADHEDEGDHEHPPPGAADGEPGDQLLPAPWVLAMVGLLAAAWVRRPGSRR